MKELKEPCKTLIKTNRCLGCNRLELDYFEGDDKCVYARSIKNNGIYNTNINSNISNYNTTLFSSYGN